jgi:hypothetical protein
MIRKDARADEDLGVKDLGVNDVCVRCADVRAIFTSCLLEHHGTPDLINQSFVVTTREQGSITSQTIDSTQRAELRPKKLEHRTWLRWSLSDLNAVIREGTMLHRRRVSVCGGNVLDTPLQPVF